MVSLVNIFKEIFGFNNKFAIYNLISRNLKLRYRKSILGILWTMMIPAFNALVFFFAFQIVFKAKIPHYLMFLISGMVCWVFFSQAILSGLESIAGNHSILNKVPIAPSVFPLSETIGMFVNLVLSFPVLVAVAYIGGNGISWIWFLTIPWIIFLFFQAYAFGLLCGVIFVYFRDLRHIAVIVLQAWFYLTPVVYQGSMVPEQFAFVKYINPVWKVFSNIHSLFLNEVLDTYFQDLLVGTAWTLFLVMTSAFVYSQQRKKMVEKL